MTKKRPRRQIEREEIVTDRRVSIVNYEEARLGQRGLDTFKVYKIGDDGKPIKLMEIEGHEIGMSQSESEVAKLPIYQIFKYVEVEAELRITEALNDPSDISKDPRVATRNEDGTEYTKVVVALLWPGEWSYVERTLGESAEDLG